MEGPSATLHHLKAVVAWNSALDHLCATPFIKQTVMNSLVGLVEVPHGDFSMLAADELIDMYQLKHGLDPEAEYVQHMTDILHKEYTPVFSGTVHAEATLMGPPAHECHKSEGGLLGEFLRKEGCP
jgi:hypothetical protein